jgi:hypothetical protein
MIGTETVLMSLDPQHADQRLVLRRAFLTGAIVPCDLVRSAGPVRIVDYSETFRDGCFELAIAITEVPREPVGGSAADGG